MRLDLHLHIHADVDDDPGVLAALARIEQKLDSLTDADRQPEVDALTGKLRRQTDRLAAAVATHEPKE